MKKSILAASLCCVALSSQASVSAEATIDWSTLDITLIDLDPDDGIATSMTWFDETSSVGAWQADGWQDVEEATDSWASTISAATTDALATAAPSALQATVEDVINGDAFAHRIGHFALSANTAVTFSLEASYALLPGGWAYTSVRAELPGVFDVDSLGPEQPYDTGLPYSGRGILTVSLTNDTTETLNGTFEANAYVQVTAIPEPETYALFLAGLGLIGLLARRPRMQ